MKKNIFRLLYWLIISLTFSSCQKEIDINLNSANPKIVIESEISDLLASCKVKLTKTVNYNETNNFPAVSGAEVRISDNVGNSEILTETSSGIYTSSTLQGVSGRIYTLEITDNGKNYLAVSEMPFPVDIDTLTVENSFFGNNKFVTAKFKDPAGVENYYRLIQIVNGIQKTDIFIVSDYLQDGQTISQTLFFREDDDLATGDSVIVLLQNIDKDVYEYFRTLSQLSGSGGQSATPANPSSNFDNGALGFLNAYAVRSKLLVVQ